MSLSLAASNLASAALAKILPVLQAKSVELATAAGSLLIAGGAVLGLHAATHWDDAKKIVAQNQQAKMQLAVRRQTVQRQERRLRIAGQKYQSEHSGTAPVRQGIYQHVTVSARALLVDMPHWAASDGMTITMNWAKGDDPGQPFQTTMLPAYPGVHTVTFTLMGSYQHLSGLQRFFDELPPFAALTGIKITGSHFSAKVNLYGVFSA
ncbi:hypothetical protein [Acidithiobacillus ferridurans]|uniref:Uncharacterized protein n=1 Tax=Acidithiobacillus ferridurans TaxID=1232575 RepID=A0A8X8G9K6_ACIFI|nr:hypothetical protein [Acidithiobacillus ferridurans]MBU2715026.1 hypothetical protein [Acidithiobacillus ferridurans]MBU2723285.1 hypothetical protein [Acidithiobacillus ferridurans]MBU2725418.1 hypothetical protein [Acidithiobacillus ferridurans]